MIGILVGTKLQVRMAQGITAPVSGLVDEARTSLFYLYVSYSTAVSCASPFSLALAFNAFTS